MKTSAMIMFISIEEQTSIVIDRKQVYLIKIFHQIRDLLKQTDENKFDDEYRENPS